MNCYLIEHYLKNPTTGEEGWEIEFDFVYAATLAEAIEKLKAVKGERFDVVIQASQHDAPFDLKFLDRKPTVIGGVAE